MQLSIGNKASSYQDPIVTNGGVFSDSEDSSEEHRRVLAKIQGKNGNSEKQTLIEESFKRTVEKKSVTNASLPKMSEKGGFDLSLFGLANASSAVKQSLKNIETPVEVVVGAEKKKPNNKKKTKKKRSKSPTGKGKKKRKAKPVQPPLDEVAPQTVLAATMSSFIKLSIYRAFFDPEIWQSPPDEENDTSEVFQEKLAIQDIQQAAVLFFNALKEHTIVFLDTLRRDLVSKVKSDTDPLIVFFDQLAQHTELHVEQARKSPKTTKANAVLDVWTAEVHDPSNPLAKGTTKRKASTSKILTLTPNTNDNDKDQKPFSIVCNQRGAAFLILSHTIMHFREYIDRVIQDKCADHINKKLSFNELWKSLIGKHAAKPCDKWAWSSKEPFVKPIVSLYKTLVISFTIIENLNNGSHPTDVCVEEP